MRWLLWREYRLNRPVVVTSLFILVAPYLIGSMWIVLDEIYDRAATMESYSAAAVISLMCTQLILVVLGANAIAGERADRSAAFLAYLPISRVRRVVAKLLLAGGVVSVLWICNLIVSLLLVQDFEHLAARFDASFFGFAMTTGLAFYGVAWCVSAFQSSTTYAALIGLSVPALVGFGVTGLDWMVPGVKVTSTGTLYGTICGFLGAIGLVVGTYEFLRRVEP